ncbi:MAG: hypothetical protein C0598_12530 [Marinilabiliales bacterium]|nr:MAG: hypothetical protein C0598_12530 [Marinilabiliales bacterium]
MKKAIYLLILTLIFINVKAFSQQDQSTYANAAQKMLNSNSKLTIGGYGQIDFNQPLDNSKFSAGNLDVHRLVMLFGYRFTKKLQFVTEIEFEHVKEVYIEQAFINYSFNNYINFRAGLMLVPMGIINEYHEPTTFNGVERPIIDKYISPTTWREIGLGFSGLIPEISMRYQAYIMNGFASYNDGDFLLSGANGLRKGRQKGAESFINTPSLATKIEYYGILGLNLGFSTYFGKTQSTLYDGVDKDANIDIATADSTVVGVKMIGFDARYSRKGFGFRGQFYNVWLSNTVQYNSIAQNKGTTADLGDGMFGYYAEISYNVFHEFDKLKTMLIPFVRYSNYDTHYSVNANITANDSYNKTYITTGFSWKLSQGVVLKTDMQFVKSKANSKYEKHFNAGIGVWF